VFLIRLRLSPHCQKGYISKYKHWSHFAVVRACYQRLVVSYFAVTMIAVKIWDINTFTLGFRDIRRLVVVYLRCCWKGLKRVSFVNFCTFSAFQLLAIFIFRGNSHIFRYSVMVFNKVLTFVVLQYPAQELIFIFVVIFVLLIVL